MLDANELERMAKARPDECFLKGSGVLKLLDAIRQLETEIRARDRVPVAAPPPWMGPAFCEFLRGEGFSDAEASSIVARTKWEAAAHPQTLTSDERYERGGKQIEATLRAAAAGVQESQPQPQEENRK